MYLKEISVLNFKNYEEANLSFSNNVNCLLGNNGEGKTNILDAIYYLSFCKSYFNPIDSQNIKFDEQFFVVEGLYNNNDKEEKIYCGVKKGQKKQFKVNGKQYEKYSDHIGKYPLVIVSPSDVALIIEGSELRRKFVDGFISQYDKNYLNNLLSYNKALQHRNQLLKGFFINKNYDADALEVWNEHLIKYGSYIYEQRQSFLTEFIPVFKKYYELLSGRSENVGLVYKSQLNDDQFATLLHKNIDKDRGNSYTNFGIHKDDLLFTINNYPIKKFGSQGQQKTYVLSLKLAQAEHIKLLTNNSPVLILDDIYDKLDNKRTSHLMQLVGNGDFGQIFISDTDINRLPKMLNDKRIEHKVFKVVNGEIYE